MAELSKSASSKGKINFPFAAIVIPVELAVCFLIYFFVLGDGSHFEGGDNTKHPLPGDYFGIVYKGGLIVPFLMCLVLLVITFTIERFITIIKASGKGSSSGFIQRLRALLAADNIPQAKAECDKQRGSLGNVVKAGLEKYEQMMHDTELTKDQKVLAIQKDFEEATELELPALEKNLVILATIASISTLTGLLGTVLGMIKAFAALATTGAPDSIKLANGISEALVNTALGIFASALAIIFYNIFTTKIDKLTYAIDEAGFSIVQQFSATKK